MCHETWIFHANEKRKKKILKKIPESGKVDTLTTSVLMISSSFLHIGHHRNKKGNCYSMDDLSCIRKHMAQYTNILYLAQCTNLLYLVQSAHLLYLAPDIDLLYLVYGADLLYLAQNANIFYLAQDVDLLYSIQGVDLLYQ